ncbi:MAG: 5'-nucleotidase [Desulfovibrio sp.]
MPFSTVFLDLDGTIVDSMPGITNSVSYALKQFGIDAKPESLRKFVGPPLRESFQFYFPETFNEDTVDAVIGHFRTRYADKGVHELTVYPGIPELIASLHDAAIPVALATSKAEYFAQQILEETNLARYFAFVAGADYSTNRLSKGDVLRHALANMPHTTPARSIMVGDREHDIFGAHEVSMPCAAVLYGYGNREEFENAGADHILKTVADLHAWLLD